MGFDLSIQSQISKHLISEVSVIKYPSTVDSLDVVISLKSSHRLVPSIDIATVRYEPWLVQCEAAKELQYSRFF